MLKEEMVELAELVATSVVAALKKEGLVGKAEKIPMSEKNAYTKTKSLLFNYCGFKKIVAERMEEIEQIKKYGVPQKDGSIVAYSSKSNTVRGTVLKEESVEKAVDNVLCAIQPTVDALALIDKCMGEMKYDPYYRILEMRYFEGRTQEDIADEFGCSQVTISKNDKRLVRELSMRLFPNQAINELLK